MVLRWRVDDKKQERRFSGRAWRTRRPQPLPYLSSKKALLLLLLLLLLLPPPLLLAHMT